MEIIRESTKAIVACGTSNGPNDLYRLTLAPEEASQSHTTLAAYHGALPAQNQATNKDASLWHQRTGHISPEYLRALRNAAEGVDIPQVPDSLHCDACHLASQRRQNNREPHKRAEKPFERVYSDVSGPHECTALNERWFVVFIDDHTRYEWVFILRTKGDVKDAVAQFFKLIERQYGVQVKVLHTDNGGEYVNGVLKARAANQGWVHEKTAPYNPEQNGPPERAMGVI